MNLFPQLLLSLVIFYQSMFAGQWPQWRGEYRNGRSDDIIKLSQDWSPNGPKLIWESKEIPSQDYGGFSSVIADRKSVYLSLVWHKDVPTQTRKICSLVLRKLGARKLNLPPDLIQKAENDRLSNSPRLRGEELENWIDEWISNNLNQKQKLTVGDLITSRFKKGRLALPMSVIDRLFEVKDKVFENQKELDLWLSKEGFSEELKNKISDAVPPTKQVAEDVVIAWNVETGGVQWKTSLDSVPTGRKSSSTPCLSDNKIFTIGSEKIYCLDSLSGNLIWNQTLPTKEIASSILSYQNLVIVLAGHLLAYDKNTGRLIWENKEVVGKASSPIIWNTRNKILLICNSSNHVFALDPSNGKTFWMGPGGGSSTPVCNEDYLLVHAKKEEVGLIAYKFKNEKIEEKWRIPKLTRRTDSSPLIHDGHAYLIGSGMRLCVHLETGKILRKTMAKHDISSPIFAGGKILAYEINGNFLKMIDPSPNHFQEVQKTKISALRCTSPCLVGTKLIVRQEKKIACYELGSGSKK